ncbi:hypothetical protein Ancab_009978 [Ancistrocladus abbreviatus]
MDDEEDNAQDQKGENEMIINPNSEPKKTIKIEVAVTKKKNDNQHIPVELILNKILPRLPVKSLLRFKSACKEWRSTISSPEFAELQLKRSVSNPSSQSIVACVDSAYMFKLNYGAFDKINNKNDQDCPFDQRKLLVRLENNNFKGTVSLAGSCNGLLAIIDNQCLSFCIWNPSTRMSNKLSLPHKIWRSIHNLRRRQSLFAYGFGYVSSIDDYKFFAGGLSGCIHVHTLRRKQWRQIDSKFIHNGAARTEVHPSAGLLVNETVYWKMNSNVADENCVLGLNLESETFQKFPLPLCGHGGEGNALHYDLFGMGGCLCAADYCRRCTMIWALKQEGDGDPWTKLFDFKWNRRSLISEFGPASFFRFTETSKFLIVKDDGTFVIADCNRSHRHARLSLLLEMNVEMGWELPLLYSPWSM